MPREIQRSAECCTVSPIGTRLQFDVEQGSAISTPSIKVRSYAAGIVVWLFTAEVLDNSVSSPSSQCVFRRQQGLLSLAFGPMFGVSGYPSYFYLSYTTQLDDGVSWLVPCSRQLKAKHARGRLIQYAEARGLKTNVQAAAEVL